MLAWGGGGLGLPPITIDTTTERAPPPPPTPLEFPTYIPSGSGRPPNEASCNKLYRLLSRLKRPQEVSEALLAEFNVKVEADVKLSEIVPGGRLPSLPPYQWKGQNEISSGSTEHVPGNGYPPAEKERYDLLKKEILFDNDDAFRAISRQQPLPGRQAVRLTYSRKFWVTLENVSQYWDCSIDNYFEQPVDEPFLPREQNERYPMEVQATHHADNQPDIVPSDSMMDIDEVPSANGNGTERQNPPKTRQRYTGRRISSGCDMPETVREEMIRGFVEMVAWPFSCHIHVPSIPPRLLVKNMLFPVRHTFTVCRSPLDRQEAKRGILEGPLLLIQCRGETVFHDKTRTSKNPRYLEMCDLLRETVAAVHLAQERAREDIVETKPGEGKWWTSEPRWGGVPNDGPGAEPEPVKEDEKVTDPIAEIDRMNKRSRHSRRGLAHRRLTMADRWKLVQPGPSLWEQKIKYMQVGKDRDTPFDDIYMLSSLNHHFSIVHVRVHPAYLDWLASGTLPSVGGTSTDTEQPWHTLVLRRTRWLAAASLEEPIPRTTAAPCGVIKRDTYIYLLVQIPIFIWARVGRLGFQLFEELLIARRSSDGPLFLEEANKPPSKTDNLESNDDLMRRGDVLASDTRQSETRPTEADKALPGVK